MITFHVVGQWLPAGLGSHPLSISAFLCRKYWLI